MKMSEKSGRKPIRKICCILLTAAFLLSGPLQAVADVPALYDPELILAIDVVRELDIRDAKGRPLQVSYNTGLQGRGLPGTNGREPDYQGVVGYAVVPNEPDFCDSPRFAAYFWMVPVYGETAEGTMGDQSGTVSHKTPVAVIGQNLEQADDGTWQGHLRTIRLDSKEICWMDVRNFTTTDYWTLSPAKASAYGYCLAVFREGSREEPKTENGKGISFRDGTRILIPYEGAVQAQSPDPEKLPVLGIVYKKEDGKAVPMVVFLNERDLYLIY